MSNVQKSEVTASLRVDVPLNIKLRLVNDKVSKRESMNHTTTVALQEYYERQDKESQTAK